MLSQPSVNEMTKIMEINDACHLDHLRLLSDKIVTWDMIAYDLGLSEGDIEAIKRNYSNYKLQKYQMLLEWKNKKGQYATYKSLIDIFTKAKEVNLADILRYEIIKVPVSSISATLQKCKDHLIQHYSQGIECAYDQCTWPPPPQSEIYINLALIKQQNVKLNKIDDDYTRSTIHHCPDDVLKEKVPIELKDIFKFEKCERKCILIEAGPGLGKTTLSFKICRDWATGYLLKEYDAVIMLQVRFPKLQEAKKITDLLLTIDEDDEFIEKLWKEIHKSGGDRICFIVEGFDELPQNLQEDSIFTRILKQLPHALIIYTSRPVAVSQLRQTLISKRIEIIGFKFEQVQQYVEKILSKEGGCEQTRKSKALNLMRIIESNTYLKTLFHIPIYLAILTYLFNNEKLLPSTRTEIYILLIINVVLRYLMEKKRDGIKFLESLECLPKNEYTHFFNICQLAFKGLKDSRVTFNTTHLHKYNIPENINGLGLLHIAPALSNYGILKSLNFMHLNFQEFCAAFYIHKQSEHWQHETFSEYRDNPKFQICWQFFAGLTKLKYQHIFAYMIPQVNINSSLCKHDLIQLLLCLHEARSPDLCKQAIEIMNGVIDLSGYDMDMLSCSSLSYFIKNCAPSSIRTLKLTWCGIGDAGLQHICEALINSDHKSNSYTSDHHLLNLDFSHNELTEKGAHHIARLMSSPCLIKSLNCAGNYKLGDNGVETIVHSLPNNCVEILKLRKTGLAFKAMQAIGKMLYGDSNLRVLDISKNSLDCKMLGCLSEPLACNCTLTTLLLKWCELGANEAKVLVSINYKVLANLDLGYNKLGNGGIASVIRAIKENKTLQTLNLNVSGISCNDACYIADLISANLCHISSLHISGNFEEHGLATVCEALKNNVYLTSLDLTPSSMSVAASPLNCLVDVFNSTNIRSLQIVPPCDCSVLSAAIASNSTLEELKICAQVTDGFATLTQGISNNKTITRLEFLFTKLEKQWLTDISDMLKTKNNLKSLVINGEVYPEDWIHLSETILKSSLLQNISFTPYQKMIPSTALKILSCLQSLGSLVKITLSLDSHYIPDKKISDQETSSTCYDTLANNESNHHTEVTGMSGQESNGTSQLKLIPQQNLIIFRQIEKLISIINETRDIPKLQLVIEEK